jgi:hypothetical protein
MNLELRLICVTDLSFQTYPPAIQSLQALEPLNFEWKELCLPHFLVERMKVLTHSVVNPGVAY